MTSEPHHLSPDCAVSKHVACSGEAWDVEADTPAPCSCPCHAETEGPACGRPVPGGRCTMAAGHAGRCGQVRTRDTSPEPAAFRFGYGSHEVEPGQQPPEDEDASLTEALCGCPVDPLALCVHGQCINCGCPRCTRPLPCVVIRWPRDPRTKEQRERDRCNAEADRTGRGLYEFEVPAPAVSSLLTSAEHDLTDDCWCGPQSQPVKREDGSVGWVVVHQAADHGLIADGESCTTDAEAARLDALDQLDWDLNSGPAPTTGDQR